MRTKYARCVDEGRDACQERYGIDDIAAGKAKDALDLWSLRLFFVGIYKDGRHSEQGWTFYITFALLLIGLSIEKQAINWLKDRSGCTYPRLQKFVELDVRRAAIRYSWDKR